MAKDFSTPNGAWEETRETEDGFITPQQAWYPNRNPMDFQFPSTYQGPTPSNPQNPASVLSSIETVALVRKVVEIERQAVRQSLENSEGVGAAVKLKLTIDLSRQRIGTIPDEVIRILRRDVERLVLPYNHIVGLPDRFSECTALTFINIKGNQLTEVPPAVSLLSVFNHENPRLTVQKICRLPKLQILDISRNRITRIPEEMINMKTLRVLSVMNNNLDRVPFSLGSLDSLRIIKLAGNPLDVELRRIIEGTDTTPSPLVTPLAENGKDVLVTLRIKQYLKHEAAALESDSSSESPLETPRPLKRNSSLRFPIMPATSESESGVPMRSPAFPKPAIPARSHYRVASNQNSLLQSANARRPGVTPLIIGNERNRSNSESILQATRNKRMGVVTRKTSDLGTVDETRANRNSNHYRGYSHASALREKNRNGVRKGSGSGSSTPASPYEMDRQRTTFVRRLSSLPENKGRLPTASEVIESSKGVLYCLHQVQTQVGGLLHLTNESTTNRTSLETQYSDAAEKLDQLDQELHACNNKAEGIRSTKKAAALCRECMIAYSQITTMLSYSVQSLVQGTDHRYVRTLLLSIFGAFAEAQVAFQTRKKKTKAIKLPPIAKPSDTKLQDTINREASEKFLSRSNTPTTERPQAPRRLRSETTTNNTRYAGYMKSSTNPYAAVPLYVNGRSRSNSRTNNLTASAASSVANTPRSGESFLIPGTPVHPSINTTFESPDFTAQDQDAIFEKIYLDFSTSVDLGLSAIPRVLARFNRSLELARNNYASKEIVDLWSRLISRGRSCYDLCEALKYRLSTIKLKDPEVCVSPNFWKLCTRYGDSFGDFAELIRDAKKKFDIIDTECINTLRPTLRALQAGAKSLKVSPWYQTVDFKDFKRLPQDVVSNSQFQEALHMNGDHHGRHPRNGYQYGLHHRTRGDSGSGSTPYMNSGPATPMSAALGPAALATMPSTPAYSAGLDRSFHGNVFERADNFLSMQQSIYRR
ncbi:RAM signaling network component [Xylographa soralifera]|nr:RAM signaling network component [Xylographa soralifera]